MSPTRTLWADAMCRANWRADVRAALLLFSPALAFFLVMF